VSLDDRLAAAIRDRDQLAAEVQRIEGRKQAAEENLATVRQEIQEAGLDPDRLDATISQLEQAYDKSVTEFETQLRAAQEALEPYKDATR